MTLARRVASRYAEHFRRRPRLHITVGGLLIFLAVPMSYIAYREGQYDFRDDTPHAGAAAVTGDPFGDNYSTVRYLDQGWTNSDSVWFYTTTQGSDLVPYDFFLSLEDPQGGKPFRSPDNILRWRYLPQVASTRNPDGLPVGFVRDPYKGQDYVGFSCSACHTGQITYKGTALRIDGGPSIADMDSFMHDLGTALAATAELDAGGHCTGERCRRFVQQVLALGHYTDADAVTRDLGAFVRRINAYNTINARNALNPDAPPYGYGRLDAFGRIYNRVLEHLLRPGDLAAALPNAFAEGELPAVRAALKGIVPEPGATGSQQPDHVVERALARLSPEQAGTLRKQLFNPPDAPVSYPYLWDVPYSDYVQWNGLAGNATLGPVGRNAGEVIGVFGTLDWAVKDGFSLSALIARQPIGGSHISFESSVNVHNLTRIESQLRKLMSPAWPAEVLGTLDPDRMHRGARLFNTFCASCHSDIVRDDPTRRIVASVTSFKILGTDPTMAANSVARTGYSGLLRNQYANTFSAGDILLDRRAPAAALLTKSTLSVVATPYPYTNPISRAYHFLYDIGYAFFTNKIQTSLKSGHYDPDNAANPYQSLLSYKARALNGIWATAPYLHNGSVPTLYDLLLPTAQKGDPPDVEARPEQFRVGSREFDPVKVGLRSAGYAGTLFDTAKAGNSNAGHEYGTPRDPFLKVLGRPPLTREERLDLVEYMKSL